MSDARELKFENLLMLVWKQTKSNLALSEEKISSCDELRDYLLSPGKSDVYNYFYQTFTNFCKDRKYADFDANSFTSFLNCESVSHSQEPTTRIRKESESNSETPVSSSVFEPELFGMYERPGKLDRCAKFTSQRGKGPR